MTDFDRILVPLNNLDFIDYKINGVKVRIILEDYHQRLTRKCLHACSLSRMNLPSVDLIHSKELAGVLLNSTQAEIVSYPTSIELDVTSNQVRTIDNIKNQDQGHLQWSDVNTGHPVTSLNWLQFADKMPFSPNQLDSIVLIDSRWVGKSVSRDDFFSQLKIIQLQISSNTCQHLQKPKFSCFYDPTSYNADLIDRRINEIKKRECSLRIFCKNEKNETYKRKSRNRFYL